MSNYFPCTGTLSLTDFTLLTGRTLSLTDFSVLRTERLRDCLVLGTLGLTDFLH